MSSYNTKFVYQNFDSATNNMVITHFDADSGETDSFLGMDPIYSDKYDGTFRYDYGAKYNSVAVIKITLIKNNASDLNMLEFRNIAKRVTGAKKSSWLNLYSKNTDGEDELSYSFLCKCTNLQQYKMDARVIGVVLEFTSVSPWAYSPVQTVEETINGTYTSVINNKSDDLYSYIFPNIVFENSNSSLLKITNSTTGDVTEIGGMSANEIITINDNQIITSNVSNKVFGDDFNFVWPKLAPGGNNISINGTGKIKLSYRYPIKIGDCIIGLNNSTSGGIDEYLDIDRDTFIARLNTRLNQVIN